MELVKAVILICSTALPAADCEPETALDVIVAPQNSSMELCGFHAQAYLASGAFADRLGEGTYLKVQCRFGQRTATNEPPLSE